MIFVVAFVVGVTSSLQTMVQVPFHDFDEAHRAENVKRMKEYKSFLVPLTGSSFDRIERLKIPFKDNPDFYLYYHLERPPLVYLLMVASTTILGNDEWAYRLPSFLLGMTIFAVFLFFAKKENKSNIFAIALGLLVLFTSSDLWLSSQQAQMDTGITLFLFLSLLSLIYYCSLRGAFWLFLSGIFLGLSVLSKLQPAVIFIFPVLGLLILKKLNLKELLKFIGGFLLIFLPWLFYLSFRFGIKDTFSIMSSFAFSSASIIDIHHEAPIFWYARWWWESFRPGWTIFISFVFFDLISNKLDWKKITILIYIFGGFLAFSIPTNKLWWYVLPLLPAVSYYTFLSVKDYLEKPHRIINLSFAIIVASLPLFLRTSNTLTLIYGIAATFVTLLILMEKLTIRINLNGKLNGKTLFYLSLVLSMIFFFMQFPKIIPYHWYTKSVVQYYKNLPGQKCLWLGDMPGEAVLFYSDAGEVPLLNKDSQIFSNCDNNYLITSERYKDGQLIFKQANIRLYKLEDE